MRTWRYIEPDENWNPIVFTVTDDEILERYYEYWKGEMINVGKEAEICPESCIEDFVVVNWAEEV